MTTLHHPDHWFHAWFKDHTVGFAAFRGVDTRGEHGRAVARRWWSYLFSGPDRVTPTLAELEAASDALLHDPPRKMEDHPLALRNAIKASRTEREKAEAAARARDLTARADEQAIRRCACEAFDALPQSERLELMALEVAKAQGDHEAPGLQDWSRTPPWPDWQAGMLRVMAIMSLEKFQAQTVTA